MATHAELVAQRDALEAQIEEAREQEMSEAFDKIREIMGSVGMADDELISHLSRRKHSRVPPKYRNEATGETWTGRGRKPAWVESALASGRQLTDFLIPAPAAANEAEAAEAQAA